MTAQPIGHFTFGLEGSAAAHLGRGWSSPEPAFTWTEGTYSRMTLPRVAQAGSTVVEIGLAPFVSAKLPQQRVIVSVNDVVIGDEKIAVECTLGLDIPAEVLAARPQLDLLLHCPDATAPASLGLGSDTRVLGVAVFDVLLLRSETARSWVPRTMKPIGQSGMALPDHVRAATGLALPALAACFESLGHDCEFGLAQQQIGADHPGLLRFAGVPPRQLLLGLDQSFDGLGAPGTLSVYTNDDGPDAEYMVLDQTYGMVLHTHQGRLSTTPEALLQRIERHLDFLRRKLAEDLQDGRKIFVYNHPGLTSIAQIRPLLNLLRSHGPNTLLFIRGDGAEEPGTVRQEAPDLLIGWVPELGEDRAGGRLDLPAWVSVCANAYSLWRETRALPSA